MWKIIIGVIAGLLMTRVQWYFQGSNMNFGSVIVSPNRKYIQFGTYGGYYTYRGNGGVYFDIHSGQYRYYRR